MHKSGSTGCSCNPPSPTLTIAPGSAPCTCSSSSMLGREPSTCRAGGEGGRARPRCRTDQVQGHAVAACASGAGGMQAEVLMSVHGWRQMHARKCELRTCWLHSWRSRCSGVGGAGASGTASACTPSPEDVLLASAAVLLSLASSPLASRACLPQLPGRSSAHADSHEGLPASVLPSAACSAPPATHAALRPERGLGVASATEGWSFAAAASACVASAWQCWRTRGEGCCGCCAEHAGRGRAGDGVATWARLSAPRQASSVPACGDGPACRAQCHSQYEVRAWLLVTWGAQLTAVPPFALSCWCCASLAGALHCELECVQLVKVRSQLVNVCSECLLLFLRHGTGERQA